MITNLTEKEEGFRAEGLSANFFANLEGFHNDEGKPLVGQIEINPIVKGLVFADRNGITIALEGGFGFHNDEEEVEIWHKAAPESYDSESCEFENQEQARSALRFLELAESEMDLRFLGFEME